MRFKWVNNAGVKALPAALAALPIYYLQRTVNHDGASGHIVGS